jgi:hypothetical protein
VAQKNFIDEYIMMNFSISAVKVSQELVSNGLASSAVYSTGRLKIYSKVILYLDILYLNDFLKRSEFTFDDVVFSLE